MAARKSRSTTKPAATIGMDGTAAPVPVGTDKPHDPDNPHTHLWLFGDPPQTTGTRIMHGTLRKTYRGVPNTAEAFAAAKLRVVPSLDPWAITALRHDVLIPQGAHDLYADPWLLPKLIDHHLRAETQEASPLLCYATITPAAVTHLHEQWAQGRKIVEQIVARFTVPVLLVQHAPAQAQSRNLPHLHILAAVRELGPHGFGAVVSALTNDRTRDLFVEAFRGGG